MDATQIGVIYGGQYQVDLGKIHLHMLGVWVRDRMQAPDLNEYRNTLRRTHICI